MLIKCVYHMMNLMCKVDQFKSSKTSLSLRSSQQTDNHLIYNNMKYAFTFVLLSIVTYSSGQNNNPWQGKFEPIDRLITPPSTYRTASGAPGDDYWQQRADYSIKAELDEVNNVLSGEETITYYNNSPDVLDYIWVQLDQNVNKKGNEDFGDLYGGVKDSITSQTMQYLVRPIDFPAGYTIKYVNDGAGNALQSLVNNTMMRVNLNEPLKPNQSVKFSIGWSYPITDRSMFLLSREGYEHFPENNNNVYLMAFWFPRMAVYNDTEGWQNKQFRRLGEFALEFGDYDVELTVPADHIVAATGLLQNSDEVLTSKQRARFKTAQNSFDKPVMIVTPEEAKENEKKKTTKKQTWKFRAENVRDFAFASSRKFIWDAQAVKLPTNTTMAMSFYPKEGLPVWSEESTKSVKNALEVYSQATFDYPYPVAISVNTSNIGMEYPMICFNGGRPVNGQMSDASKSSMIRVIVHEVGHNWFPMIVSSDERQWMWMDEGLNTFLDQRTMAERYPQYHSIGPKDIVSYMKGDKSIMRPIMTTSDNEMLASMGSNFYDKPTVALQILRETVIGEELFDLAFKEYANRWKYKHPNPADLFRTLESATAVDLDWFWRGWFFTTDNVDIELADVKWFMLKEETQTIENKAVAVMSGDLSTNSDSEALNFSEGPQEFSMIATPDNYYGQYLSRLNEGQIRANLTGKHIYELTLKNKGGLITPVVVEWAYADGTKEIETLPAEIWRLNESEIKKTFVKAKEVVNITIDPNLELADVDTNNNVFPRVETRSKFEEYKEDKE